MKKGTTLIEVMLYTVIAGFFVTTITIFAWNSISAKNRSNSQIVVNNASQVAVEEIEKSIRNASNINSPVTVGESAGSLVLTYPDNTTKTFDIDSSRIRLSAGGNTFLLTPESVTVTELSFTNVSRPGSLGAIQLHMKILRKNIENLPELNAVSEINTTVSLRN